MATIKTRQILNVLLLPGMIMILIPCLILMVQPGSVNHTFFYLGFLLYMLAVGCIAHCVYLFFRTGQDIAPWTPPKKLLTTGPYKFCRHPIFLAMITGIVGLYLMFNAVLLEIYLIILSIALLYRASKEEKKLEKMFPRQWEMYISTTPRWLIF